VSFFDSVKSPGIKARGKIESNTPAGLWKKCNSCGEILQNTKLEENYQVCPFCDHHFRLSAVERVNLLIDKGTFKSIADNYCSKDPLEFFDKKPYTQRLEEAKNKTGFLDSCVSGIGELNGKEVSVAIMNFAFMGGSMGSVTGEKIALALETALKKKIPAIVVSCSGGARMQEGILSLMQMAKTSGLIKKLKKEGIPYISVLTDPTTGGVAASFAMLGDINIAEPKALIGFAGPRVIEQSIRQTLPEGFQRSEFLEEHGFVDTIVERKNLKSEIDFYITMLQKH
jgi:acetyl-CoA carboxylase carboxyl transferase subunit beta